MGSSQALLLKRARETQAGTAGASDVALAVVHVKMMKDQSQTLTSRMSSRGRNEEVVEERTKMSRWPVPCEGREKREGFRMSLGLLTGMDGVIDLVEKSSRRWCVCGGTMGSTFHVKNVRHSGKCRQRWSGGDCIQEPGAQGRGPRLHLLSV